MEYINQFLAIGVALFSATTTLIVGIYIYLFAYKLSNKNYLPAKYFAFTCFSISNWIVWVIINNVYIYEVGSRPLVYVANIVMYVSFIAIIQSLVSFAISFPNNLKISINYKFLRYPFIIILFLILVPELGILSIDSNKPPILYNSFSYYALSVYTASYLILYFKILIGKYKSTITKNVRSNITLLLISTTLSMSVVCFTSIIIPLISNSASLVYFGPIFTLVLMGAVIIGILRYGLFYIKLPVASILVTLIITLILIILRFLVVDNLILNQARISIIFIFMFGLLYVFLTREIYIGFKNQLLLDAKKKELQSALDSKNNFLKNSSHQFRTPLTVILGYLGMIVSGENNKYKLNKIAIEDLKKTYISAQNLNNIINDVLTANDVNTGKFGVNIKDHIDLIELINLIIDDKQELLVNKSTKVKFKTKGNSTLAMIDCAKFKEAINNIFDNAIFYGKGKVEIVLDFTDKNYFEISIKDNGVGISSTDAKRIWKKFERGKKSPQINPNGSGLGLYLAKNIVLNHGGDIFVQSDGINKGSTFVIQLPKNTNIS
jgi:signal transduction histidine kinase